MAETILEWRYDTITCNYELLKAKKMKGGDIKLPKGMSKVPPELATRFLKSKERASLSGGTISPLAVEGKVFRCQTVSFATWRRPMLIF